MFIRKPVLFLAALLSLTACETDEIEDNGHHCQENRQTFALDQKTPNGVTGLEFSKGVIASHAVQLSPISAQGGIATPTAATFTVEIVPGAAFSHISSVYIPCKPGKACSEDEKRCYDKFSLPVRARLLAADASIDETWEGTLTGIDAKDPDLGQHPHWDHILHILTLAAERPAGSFGGAFKVPAPRLPTNGTLNKHEVGLTVAFEHGKVKKGELLNQTEVSIAGPGDASLAMGRIPFVNIAPAP